jgi:NAD(P)-dependent dehydrogenase (short-subunit alcohol dehydrogenase family)
MAKQPRSLSGKVIAITGGGRGIGKATAHALQRKGARIAIGDVDVASAEQAAAEVGGGAIGLPLDVTDRAGFSAFLDATEEQLGPVYGVINNAGIMPVTHFDQESEASIIRQIEINLHGVIYGTRDAARRMRPRGTGHIVNVASVAGKTGFAGLATYCATKHAVVGYSESVRAELSGTGIEISCVMPVVVKTELTAGLGETRGSKHIEPHHVADAIVEAFEFPYFDVFVPKSVGRLSKVLQPLPRRAQDVMAKLMKTHESILGSVDSPERAAYEARAAASAPAAEEIIEVENASEPEKTPAV